MPHTHTLGPPNILLIKSHNELLPYIQFPLGLRFKVFYKTKKKSIAIYLHLWGLYVLNAYHLRHEKVLENAKLF